MSPLGGDGTGGCMNGHGWRWNHGWGNLKPPAGIGGWGNGHAWWKPPAGIGGWTNGHGCGCSHHGFGVFFENKVIYLT